MTERDYVTPEANDPTRSGRFREAAIAAELETGEREPTRQKAWHSSIVRLVRMGLGICVIGLGFILMPLPGPGWLVVAVGLAILARDVAWADRLLRKVRGAPAIRRGRKAPPLNHCHDDPARGGWNRYLHLVLDQRHQPHRRAAVLARLNGWAVEHSAGQTDRPAEVPSQTAHAPERRCRLFALAATP